VANGQKVNKYIEYINKLAYKLLVAIHNKKKSATSNNSIKECCPYKNDDPPPSPVA